MLDVDVEEASGVQVIKHHDGRVVDEVHQHGRKDGAAEPEHVAEHQAEEESWEEPEEIAVESLEKQGCHDDGDVGVLHDSDKHLLNNRAEQKLLADGCQCRDNQQA